MRRARGALAAALLCAAVPAAAQSARVVDIPTRPGVTERFLYIAPEKARAAAVLFPGGAGNFQVSADARVTRQAGNFLVRSRQLFVERGIAVAVISPPSDRRDLQSFRQTREHAEDIRAVVHWLRRELGVPVWLVGTSRGTQSAAYAATRLSRAEGGPDGLVLTSSVLATSRNMREPVVSDMALDRVAVPVLVVHHKQDGCRVCPVGEVPRLMSRLTAAPRKEFIPVEGGADEGDPCEPFAHHGYNGIEADVVGRISEWMLRP